MAKALHPASKKKGLWLASEDAFDALLELYEIVGTAPSGQMIPPPQTLKFNSQSGTWELLGVPLEVTDHQPDAGTRGDLVLLDPSLYAIGNREMMTIDVSSKGAGFINNTSAYRIRTRIDGRFLPQSTYTLANGKTVSPLVVLD
jgi:HK97 family phage major capsid protein